MTRGFRSVLASRWRQDTIALTALAILTAYSYGQLVGGDAARSFGEGSAFIGQPLMATRNLVLGYGVIPLWDAWSGAGDPLVANPLGVQWYPPIYAAFLSEFPALQGLRWVIFGHLLLAVWATYGLARALGIRPAWSSLAPVGYVFSAHMHWVVGLGVVHPVFGRVWMPLAIAMLWLGLERRSWRYLILAGVALAAAIFAATVYMLHFILLMMGALFVSHAVVGRWFRQAIRQRLVFVLGAGLLVAAVSLGLSAARVLPISEYTPISTRGIISLEQIEDPSQVPTLGFVLNTVLDQAESPVFTAWALPILLLALLGLVFAPRRVALFLGLSGVIGIWASLGNRAPIDLYAIFYYVLPNFRFNTTLPRMLELTYLALPLLAAFGLHGGVRWVGGRWRGTTRVVPGLALGLVLAAVGLAGVSTHRAMERAIDRPFPAAEVGPAVVLRSPPALRTAQGVTTISMQGVMIWEGEHRATRDLRVRLVDEDGRNLLQPVILEARSGERRTIQLELKSPGTTEGGQVLLRLDDVVTQQQLGSVLPIAFADSGGQLVTAMENRSTGMGEPLALAGVAPVNITGAAAAVSARDGFGAGRFGVGIELHSNFLLHPVTATRYGIEIASFGNHGMQTLYGYGWLEKPGLGPTYPLDPVLLPAEDSVVRKLRLMGNLNVRYLALGPTDEAGFGGIGDEIWRGSDGVILLNPFVGSRVYGSALAILHLVGSEAADLGGREVQELFLTDTFDPVSTTVLSGEKDCASDLHPADLDGYYGVLVGSSCLSRVAENAVFASSSGRVLPHARIDNPGAVEQLIDVSTASMQPVTDVTKLSSDPLGHRLLVGASNRYRIVNLATIHFPGWIAKTPSMTKSATLANGAINGFILPPGEQMEIEIRFEPASFGVGVVISSVTALLIVLGLVAGSSPLRRRLPALTGLSRGLERSDYE